MKRPASAQTAYTADARDHAWNGFALLLALALPTLLVLPLDARTLDGASIWAKPLKFDLSLGLHLLTLFILIRLLPVAERARPWINNIVLAGVLASLFEALYIALQAARGRRSHFNVDTALEAFLYFGAMGTGAVLIVVSAFCIGWLIWRRGDRHGGAGLHRGAMLGLMLGAVATLLVASVLSSGVVAGLGHWVGGMRSDADGLMLAGWSTRGGDLRVPHFIATHLMQALPFTGWLADRLHPARATQWVNGAAVLGLLLVAATFWQAVSGIPLIAG